MAAFRGARRRLAARARSARPAVAEHARSVSDLAVGDHAAADAGRDGAAVLPALRRRVSRRRARSPRRRSTACSSCGAGSATTGARIICTRPRRRSCVEHGGRFPRDAATLATLPGIGRSTAAAIAAFACGERGAILDGNVKRVLARHRGIDGWPGEPRVQAALWRVADALLPDVRRHRGVHAGHDGSRRDDLHAHAAALRRVPGRRRLRRAAATDDIDELPGAASAQGAAAARQ